MTTAILDAAEAEVAERGLAEASMASIAARAGVAVGTLYNYFPDRDGVIDELFRVRRGAISPRIRELLDATSGGFEARLEQFLCGLLGLFDEHQAFVRVVMEASGGDGLRGARGPRPVMTQLKAGVETLLKVGVDEGVIAAPDVELLGRLLAASIRGVVLHALDVGQPFATDAPRVVRILLDGARRR